MARYPFHLPARAWSLKPGRARAESNPMDLNQIRPDGELTKDVFGDLGELLSGRFRKLESHRRSVPHYGVQSSS